MLAEMINKLDKSIHISEGKIMLAQCFVSGVKLT